MGTPSRRIWAGRAMAAALAAACLAGWLELPVRASELEEDHRLSMEFVTPHTKWAQPYAGGKTRVLVFIDGGVYKTGTLPREIIELKQRFELDAAAVYWLRTYDDDRWLHGEAGVKRMLKLLGRPWDCYVLYQISLERMPVEAQSRLLERVAAGSGLGHGRRRRQTRAEGEEPVGVFACLPGRGDAAGRIAVRSGIGPERA